MSDDTFASKLFIGEIIDGRHRIEELVGAGHFSFVFRAADLTTNDLVAVKVLRFTRQGAETEAEFKNEAVLLQKLATASNLVTLLGDPHNEASVVIRGSATVQVPLPYLYFLIEWMDGGDLARLLPIRDRLSWSARLHLFRDVIKGVHQMHLKGIYHRDLKCSNVLLKLTRGGNAVAKVGDLGRSRDIREAQEAPDGAYRIGRGDQRHRPPECVLGAGGTGQRDFLRGDLYLVGSVMYELATGDSLTGVATARPWVQLRAPEGGMSPVDQYRWNIPQIRAQYNDVFAECEALLPRSIRSRAGRLLRQLCDADPAVREGKRRSEKGMRPEGLKWLLDEVDKLIRIIEHQGSGSKGGRGQAEGAA